MRLFVQEPMNTPVDRHLGDRRSGLQVHIFQGAGDGLMLAGVRFVGRIGNSGVHADDLPRIRAPRHLGRHVRGIEDETLVVRRTGVGRQLLPILDGGVEVRSLRCELAPRRYS